jgi:hypothetical protein
MSNEQANPFPKDKAELMARIEAEWAALLARIEGRSEEQMAVPDAGGWSAKDNLAHIAAWERILWLHHLQQVPTHEALQVDAAAIAGLDTDGLNAFLIERDRGRPLNDVLDDLHRTHRELMARLAEIPYADLLQPHFEDASMPLMQWVVWDTYEHYQEHGAAIR